MKKIHICTGDYNCTCTIIDVEPKETCPVHGYGELKPRCKICGKFIPQYIYRTKRFQIDERVGCIAIRDKFITDCSPGLHPDHKNVVAFFSFWRDEKGNVNEQQYEQVINKVKKLYDALCFREYKRED